MTKARRVPLIVGLVLALGTAVMLLNYLGSVRATAASIDKPRTIFVAKRDIPARAALTDAYVTELKRPGKDVDPDAIASRKDLAGKYSLITIPAGTVLTASKVGAAGAAALPARLPVGMRAVSISIDRVKGVAGLIQPGDRVDVIAVPPRVGDEIPHASAILRGVLVLAMGNEVETASATPSPENQNLTTVTLALNPRQVDLLAAADLNTTLRLALRSPKEPVRAYPAEPLVLGVAPRSGPVQTVAVPPQQVPATPSAVAQAQPHPVSRGLRGVQLIDGDRITSGTDR
jgi:pilus assembly protein CpaB